MHYLTKTKLGHLVAHAEMNLACFKKASPIRDAIIQED